MIKKIAKLFLVCLFLGFSFFKTNQLIPQIKNTYQRVKGEPKDKTYFTDEMKYLKNYYLMKKGAGYYQSHYQASKNLGGEKDRIWKRDFWGWRLPFVFYFWKLFTKSGGGILNLFILLSSLSLTSSYFIAKKFIRTKLAPLAPLMLFPYFLNAIKSTSFLFITWWGLFFFIFGLLFFYYHQLALATLFFTFAVISREHFIIPLIFMLFFSIIYKKQKLVFLIPIISFFLMIFVHAYNVSSLISLETSLGISKRFASINKNLLLATLAFSTNSYLLVNLRPSLIWLIFSLMGLGYLFYLSKSKYFSLISLSSFLPLFLSLTFIGKSVWQDYWGAMYVPLMAIFSLTIFKILNDH